MKNLYIDLLAFGTLFSSVLVITSKNPVIAVTFLIAVFVNAAGYLILTGIGFVGITYIILYVGAITVLFLFVIMMINIKLTDILETGSQYTKNLPLALSVGSLFIYEIFTIMPFSFNNVSAISTLLDLLTSLNSLFLDSGESVLSNSFGGNESIITYTTLNTNLADIFFTNLSQVESLGQFLYTFGSLYLVMCSMVLLLGMLAPIFISRISKETPNIDLINKEKKNHYNGIRKFSSGALNNHNSNGMRKFSSSAILNSSSTSLDLDLDQTISNLVNPDIKTLQLIKYEGDVGESSSRELINESVPYGESFPWLMDENGKVIDFNKSVDLFEGVKIINKFLTDKFGEDPVTISNVKISKLLEQFYGPDVTVLQLYNHVSEIYKTDKSKFIEELNSNNSVELTNNLDLLKPFGTYGDITVNDITNKLLNLNWSRVNDNLKITVHAVPAAVNLISYSLILRGFMKHVHNRPFEAGLSKERLNLARNIRDKHLLFFATFGVPMTMLLLNSASIGLKNVVDIGYIHNSNIDSVVDSNKSGGGLFLFSRFIKNIPYSLKIFMTLISLIIISVKLLGYNFFDIYNNNNLLKGFIYIYGAVIITYLLFELYLLHIFYVRKTKISEIFPQFFIDFLKQYESISESKILTPDVKKGIYINIAIYLFSILFVILIL